MSKINILVVEAGWVLVGHTDVERDTVKVTNAHVVRVWGTDKGLGQIALDGPRPKTVLDKLGVAVVQRKHILFVIECDEAQWQKIL